MDVEFDPVKLVEAWYSVFRDSTDHDLWGQPVEAIDGYHRLAESLRQEASPDGDVFSDEQKKVLNKIATCLEFRCKGLQRPGHLDSITLEDLKKVEDSLQNVLENNQDFPVEVAVVRAHALAHASARFPEMDKDTEDGGEESKLGGNLLPAPVPVAGKTMVVLRVEKIGLKDACQHIDPFITVSVRDESGKNITPIQDTPIATQKEDTYIYFGVEVYLQRPLEFLPQGFAIFFELKHYKPKKKKVPTATLR